MELFRYAPGGGNPLLGGGGGGKGALMGITPGVFWAFVGVALIAVVVHAVVTARLRR